MASGQMQGRVAALARDAGLAARASMDEARAQRLAELYRAVLLRHTPGDLPQAQFLCVLAAVLGRFVRDMAAHDAADLAVALSRVVRRHADDAA